MHHRRESSPQLASHYDIRQIDEDLYLAVLACRRAQSACTATDLSDERHHAQGSARSTKDQ
jgi:hypothetical protein